MMMIAPRQRRRGRRSASSRFVRLNSDCTVVGPRKDGRVAWSLVAGHPGKATPDAHNGKSISISIRRSPCRCASISGTTVVGGRKMTLSSSSAPRTTTHAGCRTLSNSTKTFSIDQQTVAGIQNLHSTGSTTSRRWRPLSCQPWAWTTAWAGSAPPAPPERFPWRHRIIEHSSVTARVSETNPTPLEGSTLKRRARSSPNVL
jgi:hypothetical protein